ncbi:hypothetical protein [Streptomyces sp. NPDC058086]|uniref:hypothetical protein n=1 Tax=Streptomyces sp. NPDC058086 TaxID=3346334 RepID=UPI0036EE535F
MALGPVSGLWERLSGWQQDQVEAAAKVEVKRLAGMLERPGDAPRLLADRLTDRLEETGGEALVTGPYGWLIRRGLLQRQACSDRRCDDGIRLDTGSECENCHNARMLSEVEEAAFDTERHRSVRSRVAAQQREAAYAVWGKHYAPYGIWHDDSPMTPGDRSAKESLGRHLASFPRPPGNAGPTTRG